MLLPRTERRAPSAGTFRLAYAYFSHMRRLATLALLLTLTACDEARRALERAEPRTPHERYAERLRSAGLDDGPLGRRWLEAADRALREAAVVPLPFRESGYFAAGEPRAVAWRLELRRGERLVVDVRPSALEPGELFVDLFRAEPGESSGSRLEHVASAEAGVPPRIDEEVREPGSYVVRLQPEALHAARYTVTIRTGPSLAFPVDGRDDRAVRSYFGAARDGGRRSHHGIDIFAPRGTPVVAASPGVVRRVHTSALGGNVVWVYDAERRQSLYYAHLDRQLVSGGERVEPGDTLGLVGNTGNARSTPPHLHFGIYRRGQGPVDPFPFLRRARGEPPDLAADTSALGDWIRVARGGTTLRSRFEGGTTRPLAAGTPLVALGAAGRSYRVALPDGRTGWIASGSSEPAGRALGTVRATVVRDRAAAPALTVDSAASSRDLAVLARYGDRALVRLPGGGEGWVVAALD